MASILEPVVPPHGGKVPSLNLGRYDFDPQPGHSVLSLHPVQFPHCPSGANVPGRTRDVRDRDFAFGAVEWHKGLLPTLATPRNRDQPCIEDKIDPQTPLYVSLEYDRTPRIELVRNRRKQRPPLDIVGGQ